MRHDLWIIKIGSLQAEILLWDVPVKGKIASIQAYDCHFCITVTSRRAVMGLRPWNLMETSSRACWGPLHAWNRQNRTARRYFMAVKAKWCTNNARTRTPFFSTDNAPVWCQRMHSHGGIRALKIDGDILKSMLGDTVCLEWSKLSVQN